MYEDNKNIDSEDKEKVVCVISSLSQNEMDKYGIPNELFDFITGVGNNEREAIINYLVNLNHLEKLLLDVRAVMVGSLYNTIKENKDETNRTN